MNKAEVEEQLKKKGIDFPDEATKDELVDLLAEAETDDADDTEEEEAEEDAVETLFIADPKKRGAAVKAAYKNLAAQDKTIVAANEAKSSASKIIAANVTGQAQASLARCNTQLSTTIKSGLRAGLGRKIKPVDLK
jgi:hypothetical protein